MKRLLFGLVFFCSIPAFATGQLLLIGGGNQSQEILHQLVRLAKGNILIVPLASSIPDEVARDAKTELEAAGAGEVAVFACDEKNVDEKICLDQIAAARLVFFTGGSQTKLLDAFKASRALALLRERFSENLHLAGTSAGTAVMSEVMITGTALPPYERLEGVRKDMVGTTSGFGFVRSFIIDQHFLKRSRQERLLSAVLDHAPHIGVGVDESTAILIDAPSSFTVFGDSQVMVIDARKARVSADAEGRYSFENVRTSLLSPGMRYKVSY